MNNKGFTLIELMIVIVIIGLLATMATPKLTGFSAKAKLTEIPLAASTYDRLQESYYFESGNLGKGSDFNWLPPKTKNNIEYDAEKTAGIMTAKIINSSIGDCKVDQEWISEWSNDGTNKHIQPKDSTCAKYLKNF